MKDQELQSVLREIESLLRREKYHDHANCTQELLSQLEVDRDGAYARLIGSDFWGASGSFADIDIYREAGDEANYLYYSLLCRLIELLERSGHAKDWDIRPRKNEMASLRDYFRTVVIDEELKSVLREIESLLRQEEYYYHANYIEDLLSQLAVDREAAFTRLIGLDFWGASGSFADICIYGEASAQKNYLYKSLLYRLIELLEASGYARGRGVRSKKEQMAVMRDGYRREMERGG